MFSSSRRLTKATPLSPGVVEVPDHTHKTISDVSNQWFNIASWLKRRGKPVKPRLTKEEMSQLKQCFHLMDKDGSQTIDVSELGAAFKLLGFKMKKSQIQSLVDEMDFDGSGNLNLEEFLHIMTTTMQKLGDQDEQADQSPVSFGLVATAYRRKRILEGIMSSDKDVLQITNQINETVSKEQMMEDIKKHELETRPKKNMSDSKVKQCLFGQDRILRLGEVQVKDKAIDRMEHLEKQQAVMKPQNGRIIQSAGSTRYANAKGISSPEGLYYSSHGKRSHPAGTSIPPSMLRPSTAPRSQAMPVCGYMDPQIKMFDLKFNRPIVKIPSYTTQPMIEKSRALSRLHSRKAIAGKLKAEVSEEMLQIRNFKKGGNTLTKEAFSAAYISKY